MRPGSAGRPVAITMATCVDSHMNSIEPRQMRMLVRKPAGLFFISRSTPMRPPQTIARSAFGRKSRASGSIEPQDSSTLVTPDRSHRSRRYNYILFQGDAMNVALRNDGEECDMVPKGDVHCIPLKKDVIIPSRSM